MASPGFKNRRTPGVYITELNAFPHSIVGVQTAVPAFIGYTEKAQIDGKPAYDKAIRIGSLADFELIFGKGFKPTFTLKEETDATKITEAKYDFHVFDPNDKKEKYYDLDQTGNPQFNLYNSMRLFYANGGGNCYVVSVGDYEDGKAGISDTSLKAGLDVIGEQVGPTMLVIPDAVLLPDKGKFSTLAKAMLSQCRALQDRVAILDVYGTMSVVNQDTLDSTIKDFREDVGLEHLNYGMAYFPFLHSTVVTASDFNYTNMTTTDDLKKILTWERQNRYGDPTDSLNPMKKVAEQVQADIDLIGDAKADVTRLNQNLSNFLPLLPDMLQIMARKQDVLPPSPAMAGIYTRIDASRGVWNAPANTTVDSIAALTYKLNNTQQGDLNMPVDGKAVNAIREFPGRGTVVWGARTLDGNSNDWRYIQVRRTLIYIEQSIKSALDGFVFAPNDGNTWVSVVSMVSNFLQGLWSQGGLMGATAQEAFSVECGLGSTMTGQDILNGYMIVQVTLQMIRPAEFIELTFKQKMEGVA